MPRAARNYTLSAPVTKEEYENIEALWRTSPFKLWGEFCRHMMRIGLASYAATNGIGDVVDVLKGASTRGAGRFSNGFEQPLLLPPPAPEPVAPPTLSDLAALIRKTAETNPFVRPLADFIEGRL